MIATAVLPPVLVLIFGEILPKTYAKDKQPRSMAIDHCSTDAFSDCHLLTPVVSIFQLLQRLVVRL